MRNIGINLRPNVPFGLDSFISCLAVASFNSVFTYGNDEDYIKHVYQRCEKNGLKYECIHAPADNINDLWFDTEAGENTLKMLIKSADLASQYDIPIIIVHVSSKEDCPHVTDAGLRHFDKLVEFTAKKNITIAVENQRKLGNIATIFEIYGKDTNVGFCWDVGHEKCFAHSREYMPLFGDRAVMTHIHDNSCQYNVDEHLLPFDGSIDFRHTAQLLHDSGYTGTLMLEIDLPHEGSDKYRELSMEQFVSKAYAAINRLRVLSEY